MQQILKYFQPGIPGFNRIKLFSLTLVFTLLFVLGGSYSTAAQCPDNVNDSFEIVVNETNISGRSSLTAQMIANIDMDLSSVQVQLYNYAENMYYWDDENPSVNNTVILRKLNNSLEFNNVPAGDFTIIIKQDGCKDAFLGFGYSGLPYAGIHID